MTKKSNDKQASKVTKAFTTSAIIAGGLAIPSIYSGVAHADEISQDKTAENTTQQDVNTQNNQAETTQVDTSKEIIEDVSNDASKEDVTNFPDAKASSDAKVETTQAPTTQPSTEDTSDQADAPKSEDKVTSEDTVQEQPKEEVQSIEENTTETTSDQADAPKSEDKATSEDTVQEQPKEEVQSTEENKAETTSNQADAPKSEDKATSEDTVQKQPKEEVQSTEENTTETTSDQADAPKSEHKATSEDKVQEQPKEETSINTSKDVDTTNDNTTSTTDSELKDAQVNNTPVSPFTTLSANVNETTGSTPNDQPTDSANTLLSQPVVASRTTRTTEDSNATNVNVKADAETTNLLSSDKYEITSLTSENVQGGQFTKPTFQTHMTLKLDDSVKAGDVLEYGVKYDYTDAEGNVYTHYLEHTPSKDKNGNDTRTVPVTFEGVEIGTMSFPRTSYPREKGYLPTYSNNELNEMGKTIDYKEGSQPVTITFNENINNLKNVELTIDNVYRIKIGGSNTDNIRIGDELFKDKDVMPSNVTEKDGKFYASIPNEFVINGETKDLNLELEVKNSDDKIETEKNDNISDKANFTTYTFRRYVRTPDGSVYVTDNNDSGVLLNAGASYALSKDKVNEVNVVYKVPKELTNYADFYVHGKDTPRNMESPRLNQTYANSKFNPLVDGDGLYSNDVFKMNLTNNETTWVHTSEKTTDDEGNLIITLNWKTSDGSYVNVADDSVEYLKYSILSNTGLEASEIESYEKAMSHGNGRSWGIPEWDKLLAENPITVDMTSNKEDGEVTKHYVHDKEDYSVSMSNEKTAPEGAVRVLADNEEIKEIPHEETTPYETITRVNPTLSENERNVVQEGVEGKHTWTEEVLYRNGEKVSSTVKDETEVEKQDEIVEIGVSEPIGETTPTKTSNDVNEPIPYETTYRFNSKLPVDSDDVVVQKGIQGEKHIKTSHVDGINYQDIKKYQDANPDDNRSYEEILKTVQENYKNELQNKYGNVLNVTKEWTYSPENKEYIISYDVLDGKTVKNAQNEIIEYAPVEIPFETIRKENPNLKVGEEKTIQEGQTGLKDPRTEEVVEQKVDRIIEYGTGIVGETENVVEREIPYDTIIRYNKDLGYGVENTIQEGQTGLERTTTTQETLDGKPVGEPKVNEEVLRKKVDKIIEVGIGVEGVNKEYIEKVTDYETITRENPDLPEGTRNVVQQGRVGIDVTKVSTPTLNGQPHPTKEETRVEEHIQDKVDQVVEIGTGVSDVKVSTETEDIPFKTITRENKNLPEGTRNVLQEGQNGERTTVTSQPTFNGEPKGEPLVVTSITKQKVDEIVEVGTGVVDQTTNTEDRELPFNTIERVNPELPTGERKVIQEGENGLERTTVVTDTLNGVPTNVVSKDTTVVKEPKDRIVEIGSGVEGQNVTVTDHVDPYTTITRENKDLPEGTRNVVQRGQNGIERTTTTEKTFNGEIIGTDNKTETIQPKVDEIVEVGTGVSDVKVTRTTEDIPFETIEREDENLPEGKRQVIQTGVTGERTIVTSQPTFNGEPKGTPTTETSITKQKVDEIVIVGTGKVGESKDVNERELPFNTIERVNPELPTGERKVIQEGTKGLERTTTITPTLNGTPNGKASTTTEIVRPSQDRIVEIGSGVEGQNVSVIERVKPYETITRENPNLPEGSQRVVQRGQNGIERTTTKENTFNGKVTNTETDNEVVQEKVDEIIEVGTGKVGFETKDVPHTTKHETITRENPNLPKGERHIIQEGHDGHTITRTVTPTLNGEPNGKSEVVVITIDEPQDTIIEIGTKEETPDNNDKGDNNKEETPNNNDKGDNNKEETPNNNDNQYPTPDHSNDHDGIHDMTPQPEHSTTTTHESTTGAKVTVQDQTPQQNGIQITEKEDGQLVVTVMPKASASHAYNGQAVEAPHVTKEQKDNDNKVSDKELPATGQSDNGKGGLLATIAAIFGLGLLKSRRKDSKTEK